MLRSAPTVINPTHGLCIHESSALGCPVDAQKVYERRWKILAVMSLSLVITLLNNVTVNVALPELSKDLGADNTELQWIMDAYVVVFGGTLLVMGAFGDRFGRKPALMTGLAVVGLVSAPVSYTHLTLPTILLV